MEIIFSLFICLTAPDISLSWNELFDLVKYCTEIINALPYEYYDVTDVLLNDLMVRFPCY